MEAAMPALNHHNLHLSAIAIIAAMLASSSATAATQLPPFNAANFHNPLTIDNRLFPLVPNTTFVYKEDTPEGCELDRMSVTNQTLMLDGVTTRVVHDIVYVGPSCNGRNFQKSEDTLDYYAEDDGGNVWYMGEDTTDCVGNRCTPGEGSWRAGVDGAKPGIIMWANPQKGMSYYQEYYPGHAEDQAVVTAVNVPVIMQRPDAYRRSFTNCIETKETTRLEPGSVEYKDYCLNIGNVLTVEKGKLRSELVAITHP
jgi:hypothetical protein